MSSVGWAVEQRATCPTKQYQQNNDLHKTVANACEDQSEINHLSHISVRPVAYPLSKSRIRLSNNQHGVSYIEVMIAVVILSIIAIAVLPDLSPTNHKKLDIAAEEIVQAIRFAQIEAIRTSTSYGVIFSAGNDSARVYRLLSGVPIGVPTYDIYHPVDKKLYTLNLKTDPATAGVDLQSYAIYFGGTGINNPFLAFNTDGNPKYSFLGTDYMLDSATIILAYAGQSKIISVSPMTGRVTVQ